MPHTPHNETAFCALMKGSEVTSCFVTDKTDDTTIPFSEVAKSKVQQDRDYLTITIDVQPDASQQVALMRGLGFNM